MKTSANRDLYDYWNKRRGRRAAPERSDIEPDAIRQLLGDTFFLAADAAGSFPFRLAGTRLCALFGRELKTDSFFNLWRAADQPAIYNLMKVVVDEKVGVVAQASGRTTDGAPLIVNLELLLLPLLQRGPLDARVLGAFVPQTVPYWIGARFIGPLELGALRHLGSHASQAPVLRSFGTSRPAPAAPSRQIRPRLVVYDGGRTD